MAEAKKSTKWTKRGTCQCVTEGCGQTFSNRWKPEKCPSCGEHVGGKFIPKKRKKTSTADCVEIGSGGLFSVRTSTQDHRCFILVTEADMLCYNQDCLQYRGVCLRSGESFSCRHTDKCKEAVHPLYSRSFTNEEVEDFAKSESIAKDIIAIQRRDLPTVSKVSEKSFVVQCLPSPSNPMGVAHVMADDSLQTGLHCLVNECRGNKGITRQYRRKKICVHIHCVILAKKLMENVIENVQQFDSTDIVADPDISSKTYTGLDWERDLDHLSTSHASTLRLQMKRSLPYSIPYTVVNAANKIFLDRNTVFEPQESFCGLCNSQLSESMLMQGTKSAGVIISDVHIFTKIIIKVKRCRNKECKALTCVFPYEQGLFNIRNKVLVSIAILQNWREELKEGFPVSNIINAKLRSLLLKIDESDHPSEAEFEKYSKLLYKGFYAFEAITVRDFDQTICGLCGIGGELYLGDGNAKNCCPLTEVSAIDESYDCDDGNNSRRLEMFLERIKLHILDKATYSESDLEFKVAMNLIPPMIPPKQRRAEINTEAHKKSVYLKEKFDGKEGDPVLLAKSMADMNLKVEDFDKMRRVDLDKVAASCTLKSSGKSDDFLRHQLQALYATLLVGESPCHCFTRSEGRTGGLYHIHCRHGCNVATKYMVLCESVRDPADLYLSLRCPPILFITDTACTFARHLNARDRALTGKIWGNHNGCFEVPTLDKEPSKVSVPFIVPIDFKSSQHHVTATHIEEESLIHPVSGSARRYVAGDRFHNSTNPHKSPLCAYHDIDLCKQANSVKTSYQECENSRKNCKRLRTGPMQTFHTNYFYNYLMEFYQSETIIKQQKKDIVKNLRGRKDVEVARDALMRFVITKK